jgi:trehalose synthase
MGLVQEIDVRTRSPARFAEVLDEDEVRAFLELGPKFAGILESRALWHVNTTAVGGGVSEMLRQQIGYTRGSGVDGRWAVISGEPEFFRMTKRLHHALHGMVGDGSPLGDDERALYDAHMQANAAELLDRIQRPDLVQLHDPQTAGLAPHLLDHCSGLSWRCHIGTDEPNEQTVLGWDFLTPYLQDVPHYIFSREQYAPPVLDPGRVEVLTPTIDAFSPKNWTLGDDAVHTILHHVGLLGGRAPTDPEYSFRRTDLTPGRIERRAAVTRLGGPPVWGTPLVVQVSRWDPLKDHAGVMTGFARLLEAGGDGGAHLALVGPDVSGVTDDPEGADVLAEIEEKWRNLPEHIQARVHLVSLPTEDVEENAVMVNAIQRYATVVVQKSLQEGFGLTVTEAMWKGRPVLASAVGGISDQIVDGNSGVLLEDPTDFDAFADALGALLADRERAERLGAAGAERARRQFLDSHSFQNQAEWFLGIMSDLLKEEGDV